MPPRFLFTLTCLLILTFTLLSGLAKVLGARQPINPALEGFIVGCEDKPQPCWYGIVPGVTTIKDAQIMIERRGYTVQSVREHENLVHYLAPRTSNTYEVSLFFQGELVEYILINPTRNIYLGDFFLELGFPSSVSVVFGDGQSLTSLHYENVNGVIVDYLSLPEPFLKTRSISIYDIYVGQPEDREDMSLPFPWHGFIYMGRYCQLEPNFPFCS